MTLVFISFMVFGFWLYVHLVRDLAAAQRNGVYQRMRDGDRAVFFRQACIKIAVASIALALTGYSAVLAAT
jgi:hypothetical protein